MEHGRALGVLFALLLAGRLAVCETPMANVLTNGGFEELGTDGFPKDWMPVKNPGKDGAVVSVELTNDAHSGKQAVRLRMVGEGVEVGLNRTYRAGRGQGAMLTVMKGGIEFWYKAVSCGGGKLTLNVIPMKADGIEGGAPRSVFIIPESHIGDGQWHCAGVAYDFTSNSDVKFVQIGPRISHGSGEMILDDIRWVEKVGPMLAVRKTWITEAKGKEGRDVTLQFTVKNVGDEVAQVKGEIHLPEYLRAEKISDSVTIKPDDWQDLTWRIIGERDKIDIIRFVARAGDSIAEAKVELKPVLDTPRVAFSKFIVHEEEPFDFTCSVSNSGQANAKEVAVMVALSDDLALAGNEPLEKTINVPAGGQASATWRVKALKQGCDSDILARVTFGDVRQEARSGRLVVIGKPDSTSTVFLGNDRIRMLFPKSEFGYGVAFLEVKEGFGWRRVAAIPRLARLVWQPAQGVRSDQPIYADAPEVTKDANESVALFQKQFTDAESNRWTVAVRFRLASNETIFNVEAAAWCNKNIRVLCFEGPMIYAGEGGFGADKTEAIFPGLEWLEGNEHSSSTLDITTPEHVRYVPHPHRVTIPCAGVLNKNTLVGVLWDAKHKWDGVHDRMSFVFASPNTFEGTSSHLMGLFAPSVPDWVKENEREAATPYELKADQPLTLKSYLVVETGAKDALAVMDKWFQLYGVIDPLPYPRGRVEEEIKFSMQAYFKPLWVPEENKWWPYLGGPKLNFKPVVPPFFVHDLLRAAQVVRDPSAEKQYRDRVALVLPNLPKGGDKRLCFLLGHVEAWYKDLQVWAAGLIRSQGPEGEWRFNAHRRDQGVFKGYDYRELGPDGAVELGTCAANARSLLHCALTTGSEEALAAGLKALRLMQRFRVPRAAQVWEVPVHTPDILAAAHAVVGYLNAYRLTGDEKWLNEARRWARAGLPFLYFWNDDKFKFMRYASIPVFGATWFKGNWMGRPVQWCGLDHAYALLQFSQFDSSFPWRKVAEGVTISGMYQQSTDDKDIGMWPDSISAIDAKKSSWIFAPARITQNVYWCLGLDPEPYTTLVRSKEGFIHITSPSRIGAPPVTEQDILEFTTEFAPPDPYYILIMPVARPDQVILNGKALGAETDLENAQVSAYRYTSARGMLVLKVVQPGRASIRFEPVRRISIPLAARPLKDINFQFNRADDDEGWTPAHDVEPVVVAEGVARFKITGADPYLIRPNLVVDAAKVKSIVIRMKISGGEGGQVYWTTQDSPSMAEDKVVRFPIQADGQFHEYRLDVGQHPLWTGIVTSLRIDPASGAKAVGAAAEIDFIKAD